MKNTLISENQSTPISFKSNNSFIEKFGIDLFYNLINYFRNKAQKKELSSRDILFYNILRGLPEKRGFSEITNPNKLKNGMTSRGRFLTAQRELTIWLRINQKELEKELKKVDFNQEVIDYFLKRI